MQLRTVLLLIVLVGIAAFAAVNWSAFTTPMPLSLVVTTIQAPFFPAHLAFHAFDPHLVITNEVDTVR